MERRYLRTGDRRKEIAPIRVQFLDQSDLPRAFPFLQPLFAPNGKFDLLELLEIDQPMNRVPAAKSFSRVGAMFVNAANEIVGDADVQRTPDIACQDVNPVNPTRAHGGDDPVLIADDDPVLIADDGDYWIARSSRATTRGV